MSNTAASRRRTASSAPVSEPQPTEDDRVKALEEKLRRLEEAAQNRIAELERELKEKDSKGDSFNDGEGDKILLHFVEDGFTSQGSIWYRGQEVEFEVGSDVYNETLDSEGNTWISLTEQQQMERYGKVYFKRGPWQGKSSYLEGEWEKDAPPMSELERADKLERDRRRSVPRLPRED